jgi:hypothetical protein
MSEAHAEASPGRYGATRQSWHAANPRDMLISLWRKKPKASEDELLIAHWEMIKKNTSALRAMHEYWFANNFRSLDREDDQRAGAPHTPPVIPSRPVSKARMQAARVVMGIIRTSILDTLKFNGVAIGDMTAGECRECAQECHKYGRFCEMLSKGLPAEAVIRKHRTNKQAQALYKACEDA